MKHKYEALKWSLCVVDPLLKRQHAPVLAQVKIDCIAKFSVTTPFLF